MNVRLILALALSLPISTACFHGEECEEDRLLSGTAEAPLLQQRNPNTGECVSFGGGGAGGGTTCGDYQNEPTPAPQQEDRAPMPDWGYCQAGCETLAESDCLAAEECRGIFFDTPTESPPVFAECWSISTDAPYSDRGCGTYQAEECARHNECIGIHSARLNGGDADFISCADEPGGTDPGSCVGVVECEVIPPACPDGTVPGIADSCWTGYCIPVEDCDVTPACSAQNEDSCVALDACNPIYQGIDCVCDGDSCTCEEWVFESCEDAVVPFGG